MYVCMYVCFLRPHCLHILPSCCNGHCASCCRIQRATNERNASPEVQEPLTPGHFKQSMHGHTHTCIYIYVYVYIYLYNFVYVYILICIDNTRHIKTSRMVGLMLGPALKCQTPLTSSALHCARRASARGDLARVLPGIGTKVVPGWDLFKITY